MAMQQKLPALRTCSTCDEGGPRRQIETTVGSIEGPCDILQLGYLWNTGFHSQIQLTKYINLDKFIQDLSPTQIELKSFSEHSSC